MDFGHSQLLYDSKSDFIKNPFDNLNNLGIPTLRQEVESNITVASNTLNSQPVVFPNDSLSSMS